jgi:hypothetical protein
MHVFLLIFINLIKSNNQRTGSQWRLNFGFFDHETTGREMSSFAGYSVKQMLRAKPSLGSQLCFCLFTSY